MGFRGYIFVRVLVLTFREKLGTGKVRVSWGILVGEEGFMFLEGYMEGI